MKRSILFLLLFSIALVSNAQDFARHLIKGEIIAPENESPEGIVVMNTSTGKATISNEDGKFQITAGINDELVLQSLQFSRVRILIDYGIIEKKSITITLTDTITKLREIIVRPYDLSGNVNADVNVIPTQKPVVPEINTATIVMEDRTYDRYSPAENIAMDDEWLDYGLNFVNIFRAIVGKKKTIDEDFKVNASAEIKAMYNDEFFSKTLHIEPANVEAFIEYTLQNGLDREKLKPGNELELISFLIEQSREFKAQ